ncbi:MAG: hypothetical protein KQA40_01680 [Candidatus Aenigmarchaeota archaeon]|nr:hypothetical protein [Candidatus Aenigmarchaeota archaeon]
MNALIKSIIGVIIAIIGLWFLVPIPGYEGMFAGVALNAFITLLIGAIPVFLLLFGLLMAWIEYDEWKLEKEEKQSKKKK